MSDLIINDKNVTFSRFDPTYNNAIDLVAECVGYYRGINAPIKTIHLKPMYYELFKRGVEVIMKKKGMAFNPEQPFTFDGVNIENGGRLQIDSIRVEFYKLRAEA